LLQTSVPSNVETKASLIGTTNESREEIAAVDLLNWKSDRMWLLSLAVGKLDPSGFF
jgi:hypothetical protein